MDTSTFILRRHSNDEMTYAAIRVSFERKATHCTRSTYGFMTILRQSVSRWIKETVSGKEAWKESSQNFNIGDLANAEEYVVEYINKLLKVYGVQILYIDIHSMDCPESIYNFDTVLGPNK